MPRYTLHRQVSCLRVRQRFKTPWSMIPWYTFHRQVWSHDTHYTFKYDPMIHITPSNMNPWYTLHRQAWTHDTHYTVKHDPMIHITPSSMSPWYRLHLQAWAHDTHYTFKHEHKIQITPSGIGYCFARSANIFLGTISSWRRPLYNSHLQPHGHYTHYTFDLMSITLNFFYKNIAKVAEAQRS